MRASVRKGRDELAGRVQAALCLSTKKEAEHVVNAVVSCLECTLLNHLATDGFTLKLNSFGKFSVRHKWKLGDYEPYGKCKRLKGTTILSDCSGGCKWYHTLIGPAALDWGVCGNPRSHRAGLLTFEHQGCPEFEQE